MTPADITAALREVDDPELGINVVDLGLVYEIDLTPESARVVLGTTTPACPLGPYLVGQCEAVIRKRCPDARWVEVTSVLDPPWDPTRMSEEARRALGW